MLLMRGQRSGGGEPPAFFRQGREEECPDETLNSSKRLTRDLADVAAGDAEVGEFAVVQAAQLVHRGAVAAPVVEAVDHVHVFISFVFRSDCLADKAQIVFTPNRLKCGLCMSGMQEMREADECR